METLSRAELVEEMLARTDLSKTLRAALEKAGVAAGSTKASTPKPPPTELKRR